MERVSVEVAAAMEQADMLEASMVSTIRVLAERGTAYREIARQLGVSRNTVRRYLDPSVPVGVQVRPGRRRLSRAETERAQELWKTTAARNTVVVRDLLVEEGVQASLRTVQRAVEAVVNEARVKEVVTVRFETPPGQQLQIDFGERQVWIGGESVRVYFFVATLAFSRRIFVRASLSQRQDEWRLGVQGAIDHFGGRPQEVLVDNARTLIKEHTGSVVKVNEAFEAFCKDRGLHVRACQPYRARTKGKVESGVKYVKRNAIADREFASFVALEEHLASWMAKSDQRVHGTTGRKPIDLFMEQEHAALRPLLDPMDVTGQRLRRKVSNDCFVDLDTVRYSVPHELVGQQVEVCVTAHEVLVERRGHVVARHARSSERHRRVVNFAHFPRVHRASEPDDASRAAPTDQASSSMSAEGVRSQTDIWAGRRLGDIEAALCATGAT